MRIRYCDNRASVKTPLHAPRKRAEMANQEHLDILANGVEAWNEWRKGNPTIQPGVRKFCLNGELP